MSSPVAFTVTAMWFRSTRWNFWRRRGEVGVNLGHLFFRVTT